MFRVLQPAVVEVNLVAVCPEVAQASLAEAAAVGAEEDLLELAVRA